jgi:hypothetical protein
VRRDIAMTGEITLRGKVLPIGGLKEKLLAALRAGINEAIIPKENEKDLPEVPENIRSQMKIHLVENMDQVLKFALEQPLPEITEETSLPASAVQPETSAPPRLEAHALGWRPNRTPILNSHRSSTRNLSPSQSTSKKIPPASTALIPSGRLRRCYWTKMAKSATALKAICPRTNLPHNCCLDLRGSPLCRRNGRMRKNFMMRSFSNIRTAKPPRNLSTGRP